MTIPQFWDSTLGEINLMIKVYADIRKEKHKENLITQYNTAYSIAMFTVGLLNGKQIPSIYQLFPNDFKEEATIEQDLIAMALYKEQMLDYAMAHNKRRHAKEGE